VSTNTRQPNPAIGLALAGGAPGGAIYEIGAMRALDEAIDGIDLTDCGVYVGVSAGAFLAACLANGVSTAQQCRAIVKQEPGEHPFVPEKFFRPLVKEVGRRLIRTPRLLAGALSDYVSRREKRLLDALTVLGQALPVALFDNRPVREYVAGIFALHGRTDDFRRLAGKLTVVTTDLESGEAARFGYSGRMEVPISRAVQASTALPGLYPPVEIDGRFYVDGILLKTMHASVALDAGADLVFCINPLVPVDTRQAVKQSLVKPGQVIRQGLPSVLSQAVRTLIHSRMTLGLKAYDTSFPDADVVLLEPPREDHEQFFSNIFSFNSRRTICEHAYRSTRRNLRQRADELAPVLERHGLALDRDFLASEHSVWSSVGLPELDPKPPKADPRWDSAATGDLEKLLQRVEKLVEGQGLSAA
jgi:NTE family protein